MEPDDKINITITNEQSILAIDDKDLCRTISFVLDRYEKEEATVSLAIVDSPQIRSLKNRYFNIDEVTDVISFNLNESPSCPLECEVIVNAQLAAERAAEDAQDPRAELNLYVVHGLLHQLGFDDASKEEAKDMHETEDQILEELGFGKVYSGKEN
jgi:probable rRNA maturation factor